MHMGRGREGSGFRGDSLTVHKSAAELCRSHLLEWLRAGKGKYMSGLQQDSSWEGRISDFQEKRGGDFTLLVNTHTDKVRQGWGDKNP